MLLLIAGFFVSCSPKVSASKTIKSSYSVDSLCEKETIKIEMNSISDILRTLTKDEEEIITIDVYDTKIINKNGSNPLSMHIVKDRKNKVVDTMIERDSSQVSSEKEIKKSQTNSDKINSTEFPESSTTLNKWKILFSIFVFLSMSILIFRLRNIIKKICQIIKMFIS